MTSDVPDDLSGPGLIEARQTTYWDVRSALGAAYRIHFRDKAEFAFASAAYRALEMSDRHPLLVQHDEALRSLYFAGKPQDPGGVAEDLDRVIREESQRWRGLRDYAGSIEAVEGVLLAGHGLLMNAPASVCAAAARVLQTSGVESSILGSAAAGPGNRALLLGRSYVIASGFSFAPR